LASHGYEIGNHTLWHANLGKYDEATVRAQIAGAQQWIQRHVPAYKPRALALPHGVYPKDVSWARSGSSKGVMYSHDAILQVSGDRWGGSGRSVVAPPDDNDLAIHEIRRAPVQEAVAVGVGPGNEPIETLAAEEGPHRRPIHEEVLDALGSELVPVTHP